MDPETTVTERGDGDWADVPPSLRLPRRFPRWPFVLIAVLVTIGIGVAGLWPLTLPYYTLSPGPVYDVSDFVSVAGDGNEAGGELFFLTVSLDEANVFEWISAQVDPRVDLAPRQNIRPPGVSREQLRRENLAAMEQSKRDAVYVALTRLGYEVTLVGTGAVVLDTVEGSAAEGVLQPGDVIVEVDGHPIEFRTDVIDLLADKEIGDPVRVVVEREADDATMERVEVTITLGPHVDDPSRPMIGVLLDNNEPIVEFPVEVTIDSRNIGGPSAGMMFALEVMNLLSDEDLTRGHRIAGTGTISRDGEVGAIGGIRQKVFGAIDAGAEAVLVPSDNYEDAVRAAGDDIEVVKVETIDDALAFLESLSPAA